MGETLQQLPSQKKKEYVVASKWLPMSYMYVISSLLLLIKLVIIIGLSTFDGDGLLLFGDN